MNSIITQSAQQLLDKSTYRPVFDIDGNLAGISELKVDTDRRDGMEAMSELAAETKPGDEVVLADGFTGRQRRIVSTPAPFAAHYLRRSKKWDAAAGEMVPSVTIMLHYEVVWHLFELLFPMQYSVRVVSVENSDEEITRPLGQADEGNQPDNMFGRYFYSRATVEITLHLANGSTRTLTGVGVAYSELKMHKTGNTYAIINARRTADKGAVSDAKREALATLGPVFRRAFEDGDEMIDKMQGMIEAALAERNKPRIQAGQSTKVAAPASRAAGNDAERKAGSEESGDTPAATGTPSNLDPDPEDTGDDRISNTFETVALIVAEGETMHLAIDSFEDQFIEIAMGLDDHEKVRLLRDNNAQAYEDHVEDKELFEQILTELDAPEDADGDDIPDFDLPAEPSSKEDGEAADESPVVTLEGDDLKSGKAALEGLSRLMDGARTKADIEAIVEANPAAMRKLTPKQMEAFIKAKSSREDALH